MTRLSVTALHDDAPVAPDNFSVALERQLHAERQRRLGFAGTAQMERESALGTLFREKEAARATAQAAFDARIAEVAKATVSKTSVSRIQEIVAHAYGLTRADILSSARKANIVLARHVAMWLTKSLKTWSLAEIGRRFGGRDHTTALSAIRKIERMRNEDADFRASVDALHALLTSDAEPSP